MDEKWTFWFASHSRTRASVIGVHITFTKATIAHAVVAFLTQTHERAPYVLAELVAPAGQIRVYTLVIIYKNAKCKLSC